MTREPAVVTDGWLEVSDSLRRTGFFEENQLNPEVAPRVMGDIVRRYTTIIGYGVKGRLTPIGSGTFLRRTDGKHGILTAGHVINAIKYKENILVLPAQDREEVFWVRIEGEGMVGHGQTNKGTRGPDIGWMPLSGEEVEKMKALGAVFYNRAKERDTFLSQACQIRIVIGFVEDASNLDNNLVVAHGMLCGKTRQQDADEKGWDYSEFAITNDDPWIPRTHGGVSGSAVWRIDLPMDGSGGKAVTLEGVVFAEGPEEDRKLIAHGESSVRIILHER